MKISDYKELFKSKKISHRLVSLHTGYTREHINCLLNGKFEVPEHKVEHLIQEFDELMLLTRKQIKTLKVIQK